MARTAIRLKRMATTDFLSAGQYIDSDNPQVADFARAVVANTTGQLDRVLALYRAIRDGIIYDPYVDFGDVANYRASGVLAAGRAFCVGKSALLAASVRS